MTRAVSATATPHASATSGPRARARSSRHRARHSASALHPHRAPLRGAAPRLTILHRTFAASRPQSRAPQARTGSCSRATRSPRRGVTVTIPPVVFTNRHHVCGAHRSREALRLNLAAPRTTHPRQHAVTHRVSVRSRTLTCYWRMAHHWRALCSDLEQAPHEKPTRLAGMAVAAGGLTPVIPWARGVYDVLRTRGRRARSRSTISVKSKTSTKITNDFAGEFGPRRRFHHDARRAGRDEPKR